MKLPFAFEGISFWRRGCTGLRPPVLIGHGVKEPMKRGRNGKKWQQKPGKRSQKKVGASSGDWLGHLCLLDTVRSTLSVLIGRKRVGNWLKRVQFCRVQQAIRDDYYCLCTWFFPMNAKVPGTGWTKVEFVRSTCEFTTILVYIIATVSPVSNSNFNAQCSVNSSLILTNCWTQFCLFLFSSPFLVLSFSTHLSTVAAISLPRLSGRKWVLRVFCSWLAQSRFR